METRVATTRTISHSNCKTAAAIALLLVGVVVIGNSGRGNLAAAPQERWFGLILGSACRLGSLMFCSDKDDVTLSDAWGLPGAVPGKLGYPDPCETMPCPRPSSQRLPQTLHDALPGVDEYAFYPIGTNFDLAVSLIRAPFIGGFGTGKLDFNLFLANSLTSAHYYNAVVRLMLRYFNCKPPDRSVDEIAKSAPRIAPNGTVVSALGQVHPAAARWTCPSTPPCEGNQQGCENPAHLRIRTSFKDSPPKPEAVDLHKLLLEDTSETAPCAFEDANAAVTGKAWTACAAALGLDNPNLWDDENILSGMSFMFNNNIRASATSVGGGGMPTAVPVAGPEDLSGAAIAAFSFGSGYVCPDFAGCEQPGLTNTALAAAAIQALPLLAAGSNDRTTTHLLMQWETAAAAAQLLGFQRSSFVHTDTGLSKRCGARGHGEVCVWKVGDGGSYLTTADVYAMMAGKLAELGISKLVQLAAPDHLPRVYRTGLRQLINAPSVITLYPALIPYDHNYPVSSAAAVINLYQGTPFLDGDNYGLYPDNLQKWVRNRVLFRLYELMCYSKNGGAGLMHPPPPLG